VRRENAVIFELLIGFISTAIGVALIYVAMPSKIGEPPRFLRNDSLSALYPVLPVMFLAFGSVELLAAIL
jgi:hypothetical protein